MDGGGVHYITSKRLSTVHISSTRVATYQLNVVILCSNNFERTLLDDVSSNWLLLEREISLSARVRLKHSRLYRCQRLARR